MLPPHAMHNLAVCCIEQPIAALLCGTERALDCITPARKVLLATLGGHMGKEGPNDLGILLQLFKVFPIADGKTRQVRGTDCRGLHRASF